MRSRISGVICNILSGVTSSPASRTIGSRSLAQIFDGEPRMCSAFNHTAFGSNVSSGVAAGSLKFTTALARLIPSSEKCVNQFLLAHLRRGHFSETSPADKEN